MILNTFTMVISQNDIKDNASEASKKILHIWSSFLFPCVLIKYFGFHVHAKNLDSRIHAGKILFSRSRWYLNSRIHALKKSNSRIHGRKKGHSRVTPAPGGAP